VVRLLKTSGEESELILVLVVLIVGEERISVTILVNLIKSIAI
jgi:hypothetical protein